MITLLVIVGLLFVWDVLRSKTHARELAHYKKAVTDLAEALKAAGAYIDVKEREALILRQIVNDHGWIDVADLISWPETTEAND